MARESTLRDQLLKLAFLPLVLLVLLLLLLVLPFYWAFRLLLRLVFEFAWGLRGRRILFVYSRSPVWQEYIESNWLPRLRDHAVVLNWSDRSRWSRRKSLAVWLFRHWAPAENFNPMAILFPAFRPVRRVGFFYAFRDWKHGDPKALEEAESELFSYVDELAGEGN